MAHCQIVELTNYFFPITTAPTIALKNNTLLISIGTLGKVLFTDFVVPFEISSVLFLSAMVGAVVIGKK